MSFLLINIAIAILHRHNVVSALAFAVFYGTAYQIGQFDWYSYENLYDVIASTDTTTAFAVNIFGHYEPVYSLILIISSRFIDDYWIIKSFLYFFSFLVFVICLNKAKIRYKGTFCFTMLSLAGYPILYTTDRQAVALLIGIAFFMIDKRSIWSLGFHYSSFLLYFLNLSRTAVTLLSPIIAIIILFIYNKYSYLIKFEFPAISSVALLVTLMIMILIVQKSYTRNILVMLLCFTIFLMFSPALMYRVKIYIYLIILIIVFRDIRFKLPKNVFLMSFISVSVVLNILYINSDKLAFGRYQSHLLKSYVNYQDKTELWYRRFTESGT